MKRLHTGIVLCSVVFGIVAAGDIETRRTFTKATVERIEKDLIRALESNSPGLQTSAATTLIQMRKLVPNYAWSQSIIPLMRIVNGENYEADARIAAALALYELRTDRGDYSIVRNARFTSNARVKRYCTMLAVNRQFENAKP
jgi:hypothetical protein